MVEITNSLRDDTRECFGIQDLLLDMSRHLAAMEADLMKLTSPRVEYSDVGKVYSGQYESRTVHASSSSVLSWRKFNIKNMHKFKKKKEIVKDADTSMSHQRSEDRISNSAHESWVAQEDDGLPLRYLLPLLRNANMFAEEVSLLSDPRWIAKQICTCGWKQVEKDFEEMLTKFEESGGNDDDEELETFFSILRAAVSESEPHIVASREPGMLPTQLYGRLYH